MHDPSTNPSRITIQNTGEYLLNANIVFDYNTTAGRNIKFLVNGSAINELASNACIVAGTSFSMSVIKKLNTNDYVEVQVWQNSGGALNILSALCGFGVSII
jgi:hypothetical protein